MSVQLSTLLIDKRFLLLGIALMLLAVALINVPSVSAETDAVCFIIFAGDPAIGITVADPDSGRQYTIHEGFNLLPGFVVVPGFGLIQGNPNLIRDVENCIGGRINDGRINNRPLDVGASFAAYCGEEGDINIWDIDGATGNGTLDFTVSNQQLVDGQAQAAANGAPVQVASSLTTGNTAWASEHSFALIGPNINPGEPDYQFNFDSNPCV